ncbi:excalibur calcium-binding domain-containing protein [Pseudonocardia xishanensis]|uniref:Excalibur calcium-binding domain-containing protein n=1 Tax=Pseudonocardia xishanensis TaxID=630995 RepID=A0ABP8RVA0_9PSEU
MPSRATARQFARAAAVTTTVAAALVFGLAAPAGAADLYNCSDFTYQEDAQEVLDADPSDPHGLDGGSGGGPDGVACETLPHRPVTTPPTTTTTPPPTTEPTGEPTTEPTDEPTEDPARPVEHHDDAPAGSHHDSHDDSSATPTHASEPVHLASAGGDGGSAAPALSRDRDCADFPTQAEAQAALMNDLSDPERLDADDDGIACENSFGTEGQQVAVFPLGGVATGGSGLR